MYNLQQSNQPPTAGQMPPHIGQQGPQQMATQQQNLLQGPGPSPGQAPNNRVQMQNAMLGNPGMNPQQVPVSYCLK